MKVHRVQFLSAGLMPIPLFASMALARTGTGTVSGTVRDPNRAVVPEADITISNSDTNVSRKAVSSDLGVYYFGALPLGPYTLTVELTGFKKWLGKFELQVGQDAVVDPVLQVGDIQTTVEVSGAAPPIPTETTDLSDVKDYQRIRQLPLDGRAISSLFNLTPGVEGGGNARVNGLKVGSLEITIDGVSVVDRFGGGIARVQPGLDTVQEFRIETVGSDARYSRPATVTLATRSGTNALHGSIFETHRNNAGGLVARARQDTSSNAPQLIRNEYGVSAGGPLYLGNLYDGRNKTFWFFAFEGLKTRQGTRVGEGNPPDGVLSDKDRLSVRWTRSTRNAAVEGGVFGNPVDASAGLGTSRSDAVVNNVTVNYTRNFSPTFLNELMVGVHRSYKSSGTLADFTDYPKQLGLPNPFGVTGWPSLYASGGYYWAYWDSDNR